MAAGNEASKANGVAGEGGFESPSRMFYCFVSIGIIAFSVLNSHNPVAPLRFRLP